MGNEKKSKISINQKKRRKKKAEKKRKKGGKKAIQGSYEATKAGQKIG